MDKKICIMGLGYIGLPTASMFATHGYNVIGVDVNEKIIKSMTNGTIHIKEPGLETIALAALNSKRLTVKTDPEPADVFIICVPTPIDENTKKSDLSYVKSACESILPYLQKGNLVILESTVPPLTTKNILIPILAKSKLVVGEDIFIAYCPERVLPGKILTELVKNDRIIGGFNLKSAQTAKKLYKSFVEGEIHLTDCTTAEMVKLMENTFRDVNIALANEFMKVSEHVGTDVWEAMSLANKHPRVNFHDPGPGVGGHCIAIDPWFLVDADREDTELIQIARRINDDMPKYIVEIVEKELEGVDKPIITIFGVAYKGNVGDTRKSPAIDIISILKEKGHEVRIYDPLVEEFDHRLSPLFEAVEDSDCILVLADHRIFNTLDLKEIFSKMRGKKVIDTKNCLSKSWKNTGFDLRILGNG
ncbi:MAG: nucleotide sugar dehydrogenase [Thermoplasmata archaeon]|nr:MAG: nucleotide sugar dehydrogenase [Thermoplasmata archaeon]